MTFWGVCVNPTEPYTLQWDGVPKRLRISQATLGERRDVWTSSRSVVRCGVGGKPPVFICSLSTKGFTCRQLDLEFEESDDVVFSVSGPRPVHLAGYFLNPTPTPTTTSHAHQIGCEGKEGIVETKNDDSSDYNSQDMTVNFTVRHATPEPQGVGDEDIGETESDNSSDYDSEENEYDLKDDFIDDSDLHIRPATQELLEAGELAAVENTDTNLCHNRMDGGNEALLQDYITDEKKGGARLGRMTAESSDRYTKEKGAHNEVGFGNNEEQLNDKFHGTSENLDKIHAVGCSNRRNQPTDNIAGLGEENRSVRQKTNSPVPKADIGLGISGKLKMKKHTSGTEKLSVHGNALKKNQDQAMCSSENELLQENGYVSPSWNNDEHHDVPLPSSALGLIHGGKLKKKKRKETVMECKSMENDVRNSAHQAIRDKNFHIGATDWCPRQVTSLLVSPREKLKKVKVGDHNREKSDADLPDDAVGSHSKSQYVSCPTDAGNGYPRIHSKSKKERKKNYHDLYNDMHLDKCIIRAKEAFQQEHDQYIIMERKKETTPEKAIFGSVKKEEKSYMKSISGESKMDLQDGNPKGHVTDSPVSQRKRLKKVRLEEHTFGKEDLDQPVEALESHSKLQKESLHADAGNAFARTHSKKAKKKIKKSNGKDSEGGVHGNRRRVEDDFLVGGADGRKQRQNEMLAEDAEHVSGLSVSQRKKKRKVRVGEGTHGENKLAPPDNALESHSNLPNEGLHSYPGTAHKRSHRQAMKEKKKKNHDLDDANKLVKERMNEKVEVAGMEYIVGSTKKKGKLCKKLDFKDIKGNLQDVNAKGVDPGFEFAMDSLEVGASGSKSHEKTFRERTEDENKFLVGGINDGKQRWKELAANNIELLVLEGEESMKMTKLHASSIQEKSENGGSSQQIVCALPTISNPMSRLQIIKPATDKKVQSKRTDDGRMQQPSSVKDINLMKMDQADTKSPSKKPATYKKVKSKRTETGRMEQSSSVKGINLTTMDQADTKSQSKKRSAEVE